MKGILAVFFSLAILINPLSTFATEHGEEEHNNVVVEESSPASETTVELPVEDSNEVSSVESASNYEHDSDHDDDDWGDDDDSHHGDHNDDDSDSDDDGDHNGGGHHNDDNDDEDNEADNDHDEDDEDGGDDNDDNGDGDGGNGGGGGGENLPPHFVNFNPGTTATATISYSYDVDAEDPENDPLAFSLASTSPSGMTIVSSTGLIEWTPAEGQATSTPYEVTVAVSDGTHSTSTSYFIVVGPKPDGGDGGNGGGGGGNTAPVFTGPSYASTTVGTPFALTITVSDADGDPLTLNQDLPASSTYTTSTGAFSWTPLAAGTSTATFFASDGTATSTHELLLEVFAAATGTQNLSPQFVNFSPPITATATQPYTYDTEATDPESDPLTFSLTEAPSGMTIVSSTGVISWTPSEGQATSTPYAITVAVSDDLHTVTSSYSIAVSASSTDSGNGGNSNGGGGGGGGGGSQGGGGGGTGPVVGVGAGQVSYTVGAGPGASIGGGGSQNLPPSFVNFAPPTNATTGNLHYYDAEAADPEGAPLTFSLVEGPVGMSIIPNTGFIYWMPASNAATASPYTVRIAVSDGVNQTATSYTLVVNAPAINLVPSQPNTSVLSRLVPTTEAPTGTPTTTIIESPKEEAIAGSRPFGAVLLAGLLTQLRNVADLIRNNLCALGYFLWLLTLVGFLTYVLANRKRNERDSALRERNSLLDESASFVAPIPVVLDTQEETKPDENVILLPGDAGAEGAFKQEKGSSPPAPIWG